MEKETGRRRGKAWYPALLLIFSLAVMATLAGMKDYEPVEAEVFQSAEQETFARQVAWVTTFYPRTALEHAICLREGDGRAGAQGEIPVKIKWKCLELFREGRQQRKG